MKLNFVYTMILPIFLAAFFSGCAGDSSDLEEASFLLAKNDAAGALNILTPKYQSVSGASLSDKFQIYRLYAGANMQAAGFNGVKISAVLVYKTSNDTIKLVRDAVSLNAQSATYLSNAIGSLNTFIASTDFRNATDTRAKNGINFQLGLGKFFEAIRASMESSGLSTAGGAITKDQCVNSFNSQVSVVKDIKNGLNTSYASLISSGLDTGNPLVELVDSFRTDALPNSNVDSYTAADIDAICTYLAGQSS